MFFIIILVKSAFLEGKQNGWFIILFLQVFLIRFEGNEGKSCKFGFLPVIKKNERYWLKDYWYSHKFIDFMRLTMCIFVNKISLNYDIKWEKKVTGNIFCSFCLLLLLLAFWNSNSVFVKTKTTASSLRVF